MAKKTNLEVNEFEPTSNTTDAVESDEILNAESNSSEASDDPKEEEIVINYDGVWKMIIEEFYLDFMEFFLPNLFAKLDTTVEPTFLNQELLLLQKELKIPKQITDKLIKVRLLDGTEKWVLIHVEVQTKFEIQFSTRMYLYQAFIYAKYRSPIVALAIFTTAYTPKYFNVYKVEYFGTKSYYHYNAYKIAKQKEGDLILSPNIFALFVLAHLYVIKTTPKKYAERLTFKEKLHDLAEQKEISIEKMDRLLIFVDEILALPIQFQRSFMEKTNVQYRSESELAALASMAEKAKIMFPNSFYARTGMTIDAYLALSLAEKVEQQNERRKAEAEKQKAEVEKQKAEAEKQKAETEKQKAEAETQKVEAEKLLQQLRFVIALHEQANFTAQKIASIQQFAVAEVEYILNIYQKKLSMQEMIVLLKAYQQQKNN
jgi:hypothetical protein